MGMRSHRCKRTHTALFINTQEVGLTLPPYPWLNHAYILYLIVWAEGRKHTCRKKRNETSSARLLQTHCPEYKFPMQVFVFIHQYSLCEWMYHWSVAIDPVLNLIVIFLFSSEPGEGKKEGWPNVMVTTCSIVKGSFIDQEREGEGRYFSRTPTVWHFRKAVLSILSPFLCCTQRA